MRIVMMDASLGANVIKKLVMLANVEGIDLRFITAQTQFPLFGGLDKIRDKVIADERFIKEPDRVLPYLRMLDSEETVFWNHQFEFVDALIQIKHGKDGLLGKILQDYHDPPTCQILMKDDQSNLRGRENLAYTLCDAFTTPDYGDIEVMKRVHGKKPAIEIPSYAIKEQGIWVEPQPAPTLKNVVYEGTSSHWLFRNYWEIFQKVMDADPDIHMNHYSNEGYVELMGNPNYNYGGFLPYPLLFPKLSHMRAGLSTWRHYVNEFGELTCNHVLGHKVFDYIAAGIPIITTAEFQKISKFVESTETGIVCRTDFKDLPERWDEIDEIRKTMAIKREMFTVDRLALPSLEFCADLLEGKVDGDTLVDFTRVIVGD